MVSSVSGSPAPAPAPDPDHGLAADEEDLSRGVNIIWQSECPDIEAMIAAESTTGKFPIVPFEVWLEEEIYPHFFKGDYYPVKIGDILVGNFKVLGKLGFGVSSTVWLTRALHNEEYVAMKIYTRGPTGKKEDKIYDRLDQGNPDHPGYDLLPETHYKAKLPRSEERHLALGMVPMWHNIATIQWRNENNRLHPLLLKETLQNVLTALDYVHTECKVIHTDIKADNILVSIEDKSILKQFEEDEEANPSPRKFIGGRTIYGSRLWREPEVYGTPMLTDFGAAVFGEETHSHNVQPDVYRSPEVMIGAQWSYPIDIWNVGCLAWELSQGEILFPIVNPDRRGFYSKPAHLAQIVGLLGPPPEDFLKCGKKSSDFFDENGKWNFDGMEIPQRSLEEEEKVFEGEEKNLFLTFLRKMLQWRPEDRQTAKELLTDPWLDTLDESSDEESLNGEL